MLGYVKHYWSAYLGGLLELRSRYVRDVVLKARRLQRDEDLVWRGTKALVELSSKRGTDQWITIKEIRQRSGITPKQSATSGLWPWLGSGAEVIRKKEGTRAYCIHSDFRQAMELVFRPSAISPLVKSRNYKASEKKFGRASIRKSMLNGNGRVGVGR